MLARASATPRQPKPHTIDYLNNKLKKEMRKEKEEKVANSKKKAVCSKEKAASTKEKLATEKTKDNTTGEENSGGKLDALDANVMPDKMKKLKVAELKEALRALGVVGVTGLKATLQVRLRDALKNNSAPVSEIESNAAIEHVPDEVMISVANDFGAQDIYKFA